MKKITTLLGFMGVVSMFWACSSDSSSIAQPDDDEQSEVSSSSGAGGVPASSSEGGSKPSSSSTKPAVGADTVTVHQQVVISSDSKYENPYYSSAEAFCWTEQCEKEWKSSSSTAPGSSSSLTIEINMSSSQPTPPMVTENQMIDQRDGKTYSLVRVGGKHWMAENLNFATKTGSFCSTEGGKDMCATYGRYYVYSAATKACPDGWRLPTYEEVEAADAEVEHEWWQIGGRFKVADGVATEYGLDDEQGYIWIQTNGEYSSFRVKNYSGDSPHEFQTGSTADRGYNVRCVEDQ